MHDSFKLYRIGIFGDSQPVKPHVSSYAIVIARGPNKRILRNYQEETNHLDIMKLIGGSDITTRQGTEGRPIKELTRDIGPMVASTDTIDVKSLISQSISRTNNRRGTAFTDQTIQKNEKAHQIEIRFRYWKRRSPIEEICRALALSIQKEL